MNDKRDWSGLVKTTKAVLAVIGAALASVVGYAAVAYVKDVARAQAVEATAGLDALPPKVQSLEEFKLRQEVTQAATTAKLEAVVTAVTALKATAEAHHEYQEKTNDRILEQLDKIERRSRGAAAVPPH